MYASRLKHVASFLLPTVIFVYSTAISAASEIHTQTPLMKAAYEGDVITLKKLLDQDVNPDQQNNMGTTALYYAAGATRTAPGHRENPHWIMHTL